MPELIAGPDISVPQKKDSEKAGENNSPIHPNKAVAPNGSLTGNDESVDLDKGAIESSSQNVKAEGGKNAIKPYGILSIPCDTEAECRRICKNTIRNNIKRFNDYGHNRFTSYLQFLQSRYAPVGANNDPTNLNQNWLKNVKYFYNK